MTRIQNTLNFLSMYLRLNSETIQNDGALQGMICVMVRDCLGGGGAEIGMATIRGDEDKDYIAAEMIHKTEETSYDTVITVAEAWVVTQASGDKITCRPSESPDRTEAVITSVHLNIDFKPCIITAIQPMIRNGEDASLDKPHLTLATGDEIAGRFSGFVKNLCPIT